MGQPAEIRPGETALEPVPSANDAGLIFIGVIRTPWMQRVACPRQGRTDGPVCTIEVFEPWLPALAGLAANDTIEVLYWLHEARRDLLTQKRSADSEPRGTFALRSPMRPNPIGTALVKLVGIEGNRLSVQGLDCLDGTPLVDIKPERSALAATPPEREGAQWTDAP
jgi:tRNA-Thr(GGU) m(6)t(6)A37 methyltransferase TsaA